MRLIAKAPDRDDLKLGPGGELGTQTVDMGFDRILVAVGVHAPDFFNELILCKDHVRIGQQQKQ